MKIPSLAQKTKSQVKYTATIAILVLLAVWDKSHLKITVGTHIANATNDTSKRTLFQYKTIAISDSTNQLLGYEFHAWKGDDYGVDYNCCAIIKRIDPEKDKYKIYCRAIVADIIGSMGSSDIDVTIYDDYQAYVLAEQNGGKEFKILTKTEDDSIKSHTIATYDCRAGGWNDNTHILTFYAQAGNKYTENELYQ